MGTPKKTSKKLQSQLRPRTTRSSKARLLSDPMENTALLTEQLRSLGLYAAPTIGDGNCLFRALSDQLYGSPSRHPQLRREVCDWIAGHKARYEPFVEDERGIEVHLRCMRENATYGGHMELSAFAHLTRRNVKVIQPGLVYVIEWAAGEGASPTTSGADLVLSRYHDWEHFSSIRNLKGPHTGLPAVRETPPYPYPSSPTSSEHADPNPKQSKADAKERKRMEAEAKERKRAEREAQRKGKPPSARDENKQEGKVLPKVRLKLSSASPTKPVSPSLPPSASRLRSESAQVQVRAGRAASGSGATSPRVQRSPKRSFDESSGSAGSESESVAKRTRSSYAYSGRAPSREDDDAHDDGDDAEEDGEDVEVDVDGDGDVEMESGDDEDEDADAEEGDGDGGAEERTSRSSGTSTSLSLSLSPPALSSSSSLSALKPLTRRERKKLGLPKTRATAVAAASSGAAAKGGAGKIVIPGGRFEGTGEWRQNGNGRLDVRGFRELKI
ncbi:hypothetical protein B0H14DRAFT_3111919 [Mycena olivaceomarginata]|nr:hypothetical protein B0H14DRAFT_3111919 [Mycena olivaceomarginata]